MAFRDIQKASTSLCNWKTGFVPLDQEPASSSSWKQLSSNINNDSTDGTSVVYLQDGMSIRLSPDKKRFLWNDSHFHSSLKLPIPSITSTTTSGLLLLFQAKARESISIALSPDADYSKEFLYEIQLGAVGNTTTILRHRGKSNKRKEVSIPSRVCQDQSWISYWICLHESKVYAGMGEIPGEDCIGVLLEQDNETKETKEEEMETKEGGEEEKEESNMDTTATDNKPPVIQYVGLGNAAKGPNSQALSIQKVVLTTVPPLVAEKLTSLASDDLPIVVIDDDEGKEMKKLMEEYEKECQLRKTRAEKFGTVYKQPARDAFIPWSKVKRLRENPEKGFITGLDIMDPEEVAKREARQARFGIIKNDDDTKEGDDDGDGETSKKGNDLPVTQAWDKEDMLRPQRSDPPSSLWKQPPSESSMEERDSFAMEQPEPTTWVPEKIHIFAIDWAAFKQIRNKDIMTFFSTYGPSYVEWLADLSCNVCFEDKHTASRAMMNLSQEIPIPPPGGVNQEVEDYQPPDFGNMNWRFCRGPLRKVANDRHGKQNTTARVLMRVALSTDTLEERPNSWPAPPGGFSSTKVLGPDSDFPRGRRKKIKRQRGAGASKAKEQRDGQDANGNQEGDAWLDRGLSSGRKGFSLEDLEQERAKKRAKATSES